MRDWEPYSYRDFDQLGTRGKRLIILDRLEIQLDRLADVLQRFFLRIPFTDASRQGRNQHGIAAVVTRL